MTLNKMAESVLLSIIARELPSDLRLIVHHLSSRPTECPSIFVPPPGHAPQQTYCESQFLSVSIDHNGNRTQCFALEVLIYTSEDLTTLFVSKADSTGYFHLLNSRKGHASPLRTIFSTYLSYLRESRERQGVRLVLSLFARAQDQYLFPGSIENNKKHVLDDRSLIKWWCKVLDNVLRKALPESDTVNCHAKDDVFDRFVDRSGLRSCGYLKVPGCDKHETRSFIPKYSQFEKGNSWWKTEDPLRFIGKPPGIPERCLIPRFPDDPKARFVIDLDDELPENQTELQESPSKTQAPGKWRSVRSLDQFWEMMAFRQECAAGRLVGFVWGVFTPITLLGSSFDSRIELAEPSTENQQTLAVSPTSLHVNSKLLPPEISIPPSPPPTLSIPLLQTQPLEDQLPLQTFEVSAGKQEPSQYPERPKEPVTASYSKNHPISKAYYWPKACRGEVVLPEAAYKSVCDLLLTLDYEDEALAAASTKQWIDAVAKAADLDTWGQAITGRRMVGNPEAHQVSESSGPVMMNSSLLKKKKRPIDTAQLGVPTFIEAQEEVPHVLSGSLVRKKPKVGAS